MNIFVVDQNPEVAAYSLCDRHVVKMVLETTQILCTISNLRGITSPYRSTHINHPSVVWANKSLSNWRWLHKHGLALCQEYNRRYNKLHKCQSILEWLAREGGKPNDGELTPFAQAMPDKYKNSDVVIAYRSYYLGEKKGFATWKAPAQPPTWWI